MTDDSSNRNRITGKVGRSISIDIASWCQSFTELQSNEIESIGGGRIVAASEEGIRRGLLDLLSEPAALGPMGARLEAFTRERFIWDTVVHGYTELFTRCLEKAH